MSLTVLVTVIVIFLLYVSWFVC